MNVKTTEKREWKAEMAIGSAVQRGQTVYVYDETGCFLFEQFGELRGYTGSSVTVRQGNMLFFYDYRGFKTGEVFA